MIIEPKRISKLTSVERQTIMNRSMEDISTIYQYVRGLVEDVKEKGDSALLDANREFKEDISEKDLEVSRAEINKAYDQVPEKVVRALKNARKNIESFHRAQL